MRYVSGEMLQELREHLGITQAVLAERLHVSDKTVSKWETGRGYPDVGILTDLAEVLQVSVAELLTGQQFLNRNQSGNVRRMGFYVCPVCGNVIQALGEGAFYCHGIQLQPLEAEPEDANHSIRVETVENEWYVTMAHSMTKQHYISFAAFVTSDSVQFQKLYPEQNMELRFHKRGHGTIYVCCNRNGLYKKNI